MRFLQATEYALTVAGVLVALVTLGMWANALLAWGDAHAFADGLFWTFVTLVVFSASAGVDRLESKV